MTKPESSESESTPNLVLNPHRFSPSDAYVAVLDALGGKDYKQEEVATFLGVRSQILREVKSIAGRANSLIEVKNFRIFVFNDTVIFAYLISERDIKVFKKFCDLVRAVHTAFLLKNIFFRGAISMGLLYEADDAENTIMGPALSDAAAWYERADWIGINATPQATIRIRSWLLQTAVDMEQMFLDYDVPLRGGGRLNLKAVNWPNTFYRAHRKDAQRARSDLFLRFASLQIPDGTESKYLNALKFYDHCNEKGLS